MYLFLNLVNKKTLEIGSCIIDNDSVKQFHDNFSNNSNLSVDDVEGCVGYFNSKFISDSVYGLDVTELKIGKKQILIKFVVKERVRNLNNNVRSSIYDLSLKNDYLDIKNTVCDLFITSNDTYNQIINKQYRVDKLTHTYIESCEALNSNDFNEVINLIETNIQNNEIINNDYIIYNLALAYEGLSFLKQHEGANVALVNEYRTNSIKYFKHCLKLNSKKGKYYAGLANVGYQKIIYDHHPVVELDLKEIGEIISALNRSIKLNPLDVRVYFQKANLILNYLLKILDDKFAKKDKNYFIKREILSKDALESLHKATEIYEDLDNELLLTRYKNEYLDSLYLKSKFYYYLEDLEFKEFLLNKVAKTKMFLGDIEDKRANLIVSKDNLLKCYKANFNLKNEDDFDMPAVEFSYESFRINPIDLVYELSCIYFDLFYLDIVESKDNIVNSKYRKLALKYLIDASDLSYYGKTKGYDKRNLYYINDKMSLYYIMIDKYDTAIKFLGSPRNSYMLNTLSLALILKEDKNSLSLAEDTLLTAANNQRNKELIFTNSLLLYCLKKNDKTEDYENLKEIESNSMDRVKRLYYFILGI